MEPASDADEAGGRAEAAPAEAPQGQEPAPAMPATRTSLFASSPGGQWQPGVPDLREHLPSIVWGAALPIAAYFVVRHHVSSDTQALIIAGGFSVAWIVVQFIRQRRIDLVGVIVLVGFVIGVSSSVIFNGNDYMLKVRDAFFTALFGAACVITVFTHERPTLFYVSRYLSAGNDPQKVTAYNQLLEFPIGRRTFKVLSFVWGVGLIAEAGFRMALADVLPTNTFIAVSPVITASIIGSLFAFTVVYAKRAQLGSGVLLETVEGTMAADLDPAAADLDTGVGRGSPAEGTAAGDVDTQPQIPLP